MMPLHTKMGHSAHRRFYTLCGMIALHVSGIIGDRVLVISNTFGRHRRRHRPLCSHAASGLDRPAKFMKGASP